MFRRAYQRIEEIVNGPGSSGEYRAVWHTLKMEGTQVPRRFVQWSLKEIDLIGCELRRKYGIKRKQYINSGPNFAWYIDGCDKLKPWGFPIHGAINGYSRKSLWLKITRTNNSPYMIGSFYLQVIKKLGGCPVELITDLATENRLVASIQCFFRENLDAHRYVVSPRNQRIEGTVPKSQFASDISQGKDRIGGGNFFKTSFLETDLIRSTVFKQRHCGLLFQAFYKKKSNLQRNTGTHKE